MPQIVAYTRCEVLVPLSEEQHWQLRAKRAAGGSINQDVENIARNWIAEQGPECFVLHARLLADRKNEEYDG